jgi:hypothetical protein
MDYVGIRCTYDNFDLRRDLMLFDRLALPFLDATIARWSSRDWGDQEESENMERLAADLEWLVEKDVIFVPPTNALESGSTPAAQDYRDYVQRNTEAKSSLSSVFEFVRAKGLEIKTKEDMVKAFTAYAIETGDANFLSRYDEGSRISYDSLSRALAAQLTKSQGVLALPIMSAKSHIEGDPSSARADVLNIAVNAVPFPRSDTPLERILEFRSDPQIRADFLAFHRWATATATRGTRPGEILEEIEYLLAQYHRHMRVHEIEQSRGAFETVITIGAEALEDIVKFNWGDAAKLLFSFRKRRVALLKAEMGAPGRELAYLVKAASAVK